MSKPKILINNADTVSWHHHYFRPVMEQYFDIYDFDPAAEFSASEYTVLSSINGTWWKALADSGAKVIYDVLWEHHFSKIYSQRLPGPVLSCKYFFWINEYFLNLAQGYNNYQPNKKITHRALLPIRQTKPHRARLLAALEPCLDQMLYSQVDHGRFLPNDQTEAQGSFQRYFNPEWYDCTVYSIVSETVTYAKYQLHVTEKVFKPIAYYHPFVVWGQQGYLQYLHELGFETFENLFDESYDQEPDQDRRLAKIVDNIVNFSSVDHDALTQQKLEHNRNLFYNQEKVSAMVQQGIVNPILEYAETR